MVSAQPLAHSHLFVLVAVFIRQPASAFITAFLASASSLVFKEGGNLKGVNSTFWRLVCNLARRFFPIAVSFCWRRLT